MNDTSKNSGINLEPLIRHLVKEWRSTAGGWAKVERIAELEEENARLARINAENALERDDLKFRAESAEARVEELTTENARLEQELVAAEMGKSPAEQEIKLLRVEKERLEQELSTTGEDSEHRLMEMERLTEERDGLLWQRNDLEDRLERMAEENARLKQEAQADGMRIAMLKQGRDTLRAENERLKKSCGRMSDWVKSLRSENDRLRTAVPRVIRPGEVREGQTVVFSNHNNKNDWIVEVVDWEARFASDYNGTIVLLSGGGDD